MQLLSPAFRNGERIPVVYTCQGEDVNPPLQVRDLPEDTRSLVLIVEDPDAPARTFLHWLVYDIPVVHEIPENTSPGTEGMTDFDQIGYGGPCPPQGSHRYIFHVYALDLRLNLDPGACRADVERRMRKAVLDSAELIGRYEKH